MKSLAALTFLICFSVSSVCAQLNYGESTFGIYGFAFSIGFGGGEVDLGGYFVVRSPSSFWGKPLDTQFGGVVAFDKKFAYNGARATVGVTGQSYVGDGLGSGFSAHLHYVQEKDKDAYIPLTLGVHPGVISTNSFTARITYSFMLWQQYEYDEADKGLWRQDNFDIRPGFDIGGTATLSFGEGLITPVTVFDANLLHINTARSTQGELLPRKVSTALHVRAAYVTTF